MTDLLFGLDDHEQQVNVPDSTGLQGILDTSAHSPLWWTEYGLTDHYLPMPINPLLITRLARAAPVHESALACKRAAVSSGYQPPKNNALPLKRLEGSRQRFFSLWKRLFPTPHQLQRGGATVAAPASTPNAPA